MATLEEIKRLIEENSKRANQGIMEELERLRESQEAVALKLHKSQIRNEVLRKEMFFPYKFQKKGNKHQFMFNTKIYHSLTEAAELVFSNPSAVEQKLSDVMEALQFRQKLIRIADKSAYGWYTVHEYEKILRENHVEEQRNSDGREGAPNQTGAAPPSRGLGEED